ncbi:PREDICTED: vinexin-like [Calidris pugnax]|uniref:vinexin-like n=1 Tax=Calidris pugnax TaxID=198806 RepID=UPI00071D7A52|nr:PREDICTED: vinexin-like [Calidris pugnax]
MERGGPGLASDRSRVAPSRDTLRPGTLPSLSDMGDPTEAIRKEEKKMKAARLKFDFQAESPKELTLQKGDIVYIHKEVDRNWLEGEHHGRVGIFPSNYVEMKAARLKFDFQAESPKELTLQKGDIVYIHKEVDRNWLEGEHHGRVGIFPSNYVEGLFQPE